MREEQKTSGTRQMVSVLMIAGEMVSKAAIPRMRLENEKWPKEREEGRGG